MEKNLKKVVLLFSLSVCVVSVKAEDGYSQEEYPLYTDADYSSEGYSQDASSYNVGEGEYQEGDYSYPTDAEVVPAAEESEQYYDDQMTGVDLMSADSQDTFNEESGDSGYAKYDQDDVMDESNDTFMPDQSYEGEYSASYGVPDELGVEDYEQPEE